MQTILEQLDNGALDRQPNVEIEEGRTLYRSFFMNVERYLYDFTCCKRSDGWHQYDTDQDASYFGVWYHMERQITVTYAEGDETVVVCHSPEAWKAELKSMADFYGDPPPAFKALEVVGGVLHETHYIDQDARPEVV